MARTKIYAEEYVPSPLADLWHAFKSNHAALAGLWLFIGFVVMAIFAPLLAPWPPHQQHTDFLLVPPAWHENGNVHFLLGTDDLGRDILSRLLHGASLTFGLSLLVVMAATLIGGLLGALAGITSGLKSSFLNHLLDTLMSIPSLLMAIIIVAIIGPGLSNTLWAITFVLIPQFIHVVRDAVHTEMDKSYVIASRLDGASPLQILADDILPNIYTTIIVQMTFAISAAIIDITALGFLRLGAQQPSAEWGAMLSGGLDFIYNAHWMVTLPGLMIFLAVLATNLVGDGLRSALEQRREQ